MASTVFSEPLGIWECDVCGWWGSTPDNPHDCSGIPPLSPAIVETLRRAQLVAEVDPPVGGTPFGA